MECSDRGDADTDLHIICLPSSRLRWQWKIPLYSGNTPSNARFPIDITVVILPERNKINCYFQTAPNSDRHSSAPFCLKEHVFKILCGPGHRGIDHGKMKHWNWWLKQSLEFQRGDWAQLGLYKHENIHWDWNGFQKKTGVSCFGNVEKNQEIADETAAWVLAVWGLSVRSGASWCFQDFFMPSWHSRWQIDDGKFASYHLL